MERETDKGIESSGKGVIAKSLCFNIQPKKKNF